MKKALSLILVLLMIFSAMAAFTSCGGGISAEEWQTAFSGTNFACEIVPTEMRYVIYETGCGVSMQVEYGEGDEIYYEYEEYEFYSKTVDGTTKYYMTDYQNDPIEITADDIPITAEAFSPIFDFVRENQSLFKAIGMFPFVYTYEGELPEGLKVWLDELNGEPSDFYSIAVDTDNVSKKITAIRVYTNSIAERDEAMINNEEIGGEVAAFYGFGGQICYSLYVEAVAAHEGSNFKVVGGSGVDYMELEFDGENLRYYTPNVEADPANPDAELFDEARFVVDDGAYKYYKKSKDSGEWTVQVLEASDYKTRVGTLYRLFGGGKLFNPDNPFISEIREGTTLVGGDWQEVYGGQSGLFDIYYTNIRVTLGENCAIDGAEWHILLRQAVMGDAEYDAGKYVMTVGDAVVTAPEIQ